MPAVVATVQRHDVPVEVKGLGTVQALNTVTVKPRIGGQIMEIDFTDPASRPRTGPRCCGGSRGRIAAVTRPEPGLGLSLVAAIVRLHGFSLVLSERATGCCIQLECWPRETALPVEVPLNQYAS